VLKSVACQEPRVLFYQAALPLSTATLTRVSGLIRTHRRQIRSHWRALDPSRQALLTLAYLHKGERLVDLAAGFGISPATAWHRIRETIGLLAGAAPGLRTALRPCPVWGCCRIEGSGFGCDR
jgi:hypothetical protein